MHITFRIFSIIEFVGRNNIQSKAITSTKIQACSAISYRFSMYVCLYFQTFEGDFVEIYTSILY